MRRSPLAVLVTAIAALVVTFAMPDAGARMGAAAKGGGRGTSSTTESTTSSSTSSSTTSSSTTTTRPSPGDDGDPFQHQQWGLARVRAADAWSIATGRGVVVAVVDSGIDKDHPELRNKLSGGVSWVGCPKLNGRPVKPPCADSSAWDDENGHGTHVAGIIAAPLDGVGVVGVAPDATLMPVRVLDAGGSGTSADVAAGIRYAADHGADVINLSLGGLPVVSQLVDATGLDDFNAAIEYAIGQGVLVVLAAGNESAPFCENTSLIHENALCVGAVDKRDLKSWYSAFGARVDVVAPGGLGSVICDDPEDILSTYAIDVDEEGPCTKRIGYETLAGTSMAAPHVSGVGALLADLGITGLDAMEQIIDTADGAGVVDAVSATA